MPEQPTNAFATIAARKKADVHHVQALSRQTGAGPDAKLTIELSIAEIAKARRGNAGRGALGFVINPIDFEVDGQRCRLYPGWTTLTAR